MTTETDNHRAHEATMADVQALSLAKDRIVEALHRRIIGQDDVIELLMTAIFARGHGLFVGVPGLAKTMLIATLAEAVDLDFNRIQFTPDLMPSDITGTDVLEEDQSTGRRSYTFIRGPIFCNILLADEINRTPPKTQAALLQAMQEHTVSASGRHHPLPPPFLVFATQNPIEQEGTYPLPEAQLDRFMFSVPVNYPSMAQEIAIVQQTTGAGSVDIEPVIDGPTLLRFQEVVLDVVAAPDIVRYAVELVSRSRPDNPNAPEIVREYVSWGAGPRASQYLVLGAKSRAALSGRPHASMEDVKFLARAVLGHRVLVNFRGEAERVTSVDIVDALVNDLSKTGSRG